MANGDAVPERLLKTQDAIISSRYVPERRASSPSAESLPPVQPGDFGYISLDEDVPPPPTLPPVSAPEPHEMSLPDRVLFAVKKGWLKYLQFTVARHILIQALTEDVVVPGDSDAVTVRLSTQPGDIPQQDDRHLWVTFALPGHHWRTPRARILVDDLHPPPLMDQCAAVLCRTLVPSQGLVEGAQVRLKKQDETGQWRITAYPMGNKRKGGIAHVDDLICTGSSFG